MVQAACRHGVALRIRHLDRSRAVIAQHNRKTFVSHLCITPLKEAFLIFRFFVCGSLYRSQNLFSHQLRDDVVVVHLHMEAAAALGH